MKQAYTFLAIVLLPIMLVAAAPPRPIPPVRPLPEQGGERPTVVAHSDTTPPASGATLPSLETVQPFASAPACNHHDPRAYHGLWNATQGCYYNHTHGDDPHAVDDVFGATIYEWAGGEISYPWQTPDENLHKHGAYAWFVRRDLPCSSPEGDAASRHACITDFRAQFHGVGAAHGAVTNFHSAWLEARVCGGAPRQCGIVRVGGWQGPVDLNIDERVVLQREDSANRFFIHYFATGNPAFGTWYTGAASGLYSVIPQFEDMWNTVPAGKSAEEIVAAARWFCGDDQGNLRYDGCAANSSRLQPHIIRFAIPQRLATQVDPDGDGVADFDGYVDLYGELAPGCDAPGPQCVPFVLQNVPYAQGEFQYRGQAREYDICFDASGSPVQDCRQGQPSGWIEYPIH